MRIARIAILIGGAILPLLSIAPAAASMESVLGAAEALKPGEYLWAPEIAPHGPLLLVVSTATQRATLYRNGIPIAITTVSTGRPGHRTPTGVFTILQRKVEHYSNIYDNAPMPYMQRLTWDGIALHGGHLPGYPASHGCVRLPQAFAEKLFGITRFGDSVVVANAKASPASLVHPAVLAPVTAGGQAAHPALSAYEVYWNEAASPEGPVSILVSLYDQRVSVLRNGVLIGAAPLQMVRDFALNGTVLLVMTTEMEDIPSLLDPQQKEHRWVAHRVLGEAGAPMPPLRSLGDAFWIPQDFARRLYGVLTPGTTVLLSDLPGVRATPDDQPSVPVLESDEASPTPVSR